MYRMMLFSSIGPSRSCSSMSSLATITAVVTSILVLRGKDSLNNLLFFYCVWGYHIWTQYILITFTSPIACPLFLPISYLFSLLILCVLFKPNKFFQCSLHVYGSWTVYWSMVSLLGVTFLRKTECPRPTSISC